MDDNSSEFFDAAVDAQGGGGTHQPGSTATREMLGQGSDNEGQVDDSFYKNMMTDKREGRAEKAFQIADELLLNDDLPELNKARWNMSLSTNIDNPHSLQHARAAVEILDIDIRKLVAAEAFPEKQYQEALHLLGLAEAAAAEKAEQAKEEGEEKEVRREDQDEEDKKGEKDVSSGGSEHSYSVPEAIRRHVYAKRAETYITNGRVAVLLWKVCEWYDKDEDIFRDYVKKLHEILGDLDEWLLIV